MAKPNIAVKSTVRLNAHLRPMTSIRRPHAMAPAHRPALNAMKMLPSFPSGYVSYATGNGKMGRTVKADLLLYGRGY